MKKKIFISAIYTSPPDSMGGNTKIILELINNLYEVYDFTILTSQPLTFQNNLSSSALDKITIISVPFPYTILNFKTHLREVEDIKLYYKKYFDQNPAIENSVVISSSDFAPDVLPIYDLKENHNFVWIPSIFLFIPNPIDNLIRRYKFPFLKYTIYFLYQQFLLYFIKLKGDLFLLTNDYDRKYLPKSYSERILSIYGGVNPEQIMHSKSKGKIYDAVFCSRLHAQKGIKHLLHIWAQVVEAIPSAQLAIIGNGEPDYENELKAIARKLNIENNLTWLGYVNGVEKYSIYKSSKIFIHPTIYDNNGMVAAEALCTGLYVVMFDLPALREVYNTNCYKIRPYDLSAFTNRIVELLYKNTKNSINSKVVGNLKNKWKWEHRADIFDRFLKKSIENGTEKIIS